MGRGQGGEDWRGCAEAEIRVGGYMAFPAYTILHQAVGGTGKRHYFDGDTDVDGAGYVWDAVIYDDGFTANPVISLWNPQGQKITETILDMHEVEAGAKADRVSGFQSDAQLHLTISYHAGDYNSKEIYLV